MKLLYVGRATERQKKFFSLLKWVAIYYKKNKDISLLVVTKDNFQANNSYISSTNDDEWYKNINLKEYIFILNSDYEGCPVSLLEFLQYGGTKICMKKALWNINIYPEMSLFLTYNQFSSILNNGGYEIKDLAMLNTYFDIKRYKDDIDKLKTWLPTQKT